MIGMVGIMGIGLLGLAFFLGLVAAHQLFTARSARLQRRVLHFGTSTAGTALVFDDPERPPETKPLQRLAAFAATLTPASLRGQNLRDQLAGAGFYGADSVRLFVGSKVLGAGLLGSLAYTTEFLMHRPHNEMAMAGLLGGLAGFVLPSLALKIRTRKRRGRIRLALPDALDLLVVCVEAGLGVNAAIVRVGRELRWSCPALSQEFGLVNQEIRAGSNRALALRNFSARVPIPDVQALVAMFIQSDRLGTSIGRSLRVHADLLRTKRRQRAEERARKATVKLIFPLVFLIFPELLVVILGPAALELFSTLMEMVSGP